MLATRWKVIQEVISVLFIFLFVYTATDKLINHYRFELVLSRLPWIGSWSAITRLAIPFAEILAATLLLFPQHRYKGFALTSFLMIVFTLYVGLALLSTDKLPCSCGGILSSLSWPVHFVLNSILTLFALTGLYITSLPKDFIAINRSSRKPV